MSENMDPSFAGEGMYKENIIDHYKNPHNHGTIENADINSTENNPLCGDVISVNLNVNEHKVEDIKFVGRVCAISQAATSMLTDEVKGKTFEEIKNIKGEDVVKLLGIKIGPVRTKCAVLGLVAVKEGVKEFESNK